MKLSKYGKQLGLTYKTVWRMFHNGHIPGAYQLPSGTIIVPDALESEGYINNNGELIQNLIELVKELRESD